MTIDRVESKKTAISLIVRFDLLAQIYEVFSNGQKIYVEKSSRKRLSNDIIKICAHNQKRFRNFVPRNYETTKI
jgi:hypothetical protein